MIGPCTHICGNKTSDGYCRTTGCINPNYNRPKAPIVTTVQVKKKEKEKEGEKDE